MEVPAGTHNPDEDELLRSVASQNAQSILAARQRAEQEILRAKEALERKTRELAESLALMRATLEATWDGILVSDQDGNITNFNRRFVDMWRIPPEIVKEARRHGDLIDFFAGQFAEDDRASYRTSPIWQFHFWVARKPTLAPKRRAGMGRLRIGTPAGTSSAIIKL